VKTPDQGIVFQLYMNKDRSASEKLIRSLESRGFKAIMLTVDAAVAGKRELDQRAKGDVGSAVRFCASYDSGWLIKFYRPLHRTARRQQDWESHMFDFTWGGNYPMLTNSDRLSWDTKTRTCAGKTYLGYKA
jgi:hypothetical protein